MNIKPLSYLIGMAVISSSCFANSASNLDSNNKDVMTVWSTPLAADAEVITQEKMQMLNRTNAAQALATMPGVAIEKSGNRNEMQVNVRGFDSRQVPIFFDGIPSYVPYDGTLDLGRFMTSELSSIELSKGYTSLLQGPNLMGGAINLTTATPKKPLEAQINLSQGFARGSDNARNMSARLGARNDFGFIQVSGSQYKQRFMGLPSNDSDNPLAGNNGRRTNSATDDKRGMIKLGWTPRETDEYLLTYLKQDGDKNSAPDVNNKKQQIWQWPEYNKESFYFNGNTQLTEDLALQSRVYHDKFINTLHQYKSVADYEKGIHGYSHYDDYSNGADLRLDIAMREADMWSFASHWKEDIHRSKGTTSSPYDRYKDQTWSMSTEYQWVATDTLDLIGAIGYDWRRSDDGKRYIYNKKSGAISGIEYYDDNRQNAFNWETMARYHLENSDIVQFSISDRSRFPTQKERYTTSKAKDASVAYEVNPHLEVERALTFDLTYKGNINQDWSYESSVYYNRVSDAIMSHYVRRDEITNQNVYQNRNSGRVDYMGLDLGINGKINSWLETGMSYSYIYADPKDESVWHSAQLPTHKTYMWIKFLPTDPMSITIMEEARTWTYNYIDSDTKIAGFSKTDLRLDYNLGNGISTNASINNLFDKSYQFTDGYIEEGRNFWLGIEYKY